MFDVVVCGDAEEVPWRCEVSDGALIDAMGPRLSAGRGVVLQCHLRAKPFVEMGRQKGWSRYLEVTGVEVVRADQSGSAIAPDEAEVA